MASEKILIVEDEGIVALNIGKQIEKFGLVVAGVATSGEDAITMATDIRPDLVLMDIALNGVLDGVDAATKIRALFHIPVIFLTAHSDESTLQRAKIAEPFGYLVKPFRERDLHISIEFALYKSKMEDEIRKLNRDLQRRTSELESAYKDLETFSYTVSHDLRAPLVTIEGFCRILSENHAKRLDDEGKDLLDRVSDSAGKMSRLIDNLLSFSRTTAREMKTSHIDMESLVRKVFMELESTSGRGNLQLKVNPLPPAYGDHSMMRQVFINLLSNAIKFTAHAETPVIEIGGCEEDDKCRYYVEDNGIGFDIQNAGRLFGLFQRIHGTTTFQGTGIGLCIVKKIIEKHGGEVRAFGKLNEGATFSFTLPKKNCTSPDKEHPACAQGMSHHDSR